jgi:hypothetical protein
MGFVLRLRGIVCFHASAVALADGAIAVLGAPGAGKSTLAAAFGRCGFPVIADDVVALADMGDHFLVQPGYPRVNLWPDSVRELFGTEDALPCITPTWNKRYMTLGENTSIFASSALPLTTIYILCDREASRPTTVIEALTGREAFMALVANSYVSHLLDRRMRSLEFEALGRVFTSVPVRRVRRTADDPSGVFTIRELITSDASRLSNSKKFSVIERSK